MGHISYIDIKNFVFNSHIFTQFDVNLKTVTVVIETSDKHFTNLEENLEKYIYILFDPSEPRPP